MKTNTDKQSGLPSRPEQLSTGDTGLVRINLAQRRVNRGLNTKTLLALLRGSSEALFARAEVVGKWVWIQFAEKQPREITSRLSELGFHWNRVRQTWQHPCGQYRRQASVFDPRQRYGSHFVAGGKLL